MNFLKNLTGGSGNPMGGGAAPGGGAGSAAGGGLGGMIGGVAKAIGLDPKSKDRDRLFNLIDYFFLR